MLSRARRGAEKLFVGDAEAFWRKFDLPRWRTKGRRAASKEEGKGPSASGMADGRMAQNQNASKRITFLDVLF